MANQIGISQKSSSVSSKSRPFSPLRGLCLRNSDALYQDPQIRSAPWLRQNCLSHIGSDFKVMATDAKGIILGQKMEPQVRPEAIHTSMRYTYEPCVARETLQRKREKLNCAMEHKTGAEWTPIKDPAPRSGGVEVDKRAAPINLRIAEVIERELKRTEERRKEKRGSRKRSKKQKTVIPMMDFVGNVPSER